MYLFTKTFETNPSESFCLTAQKKNRRFFLSKLDRIYITKKFSQNSEILKKSNLSYFFSADEKEAEETSLYRVHVITGDVIGAGTDADVFITFIGSQTESGKSLIFCITFWISTLLKKNKILILRV